MASEKLAILPTSEFKTSEFRSSNCLHKASCQLGQSWGNTFYSSWLPNTLNSSQSHRQSHTHTHSERTTVKEYLPYYIYYNTVKGGDIIISTCTLISTNLYPEVDTIKSEKQKKTLVFLINTPLSHITKSNSLSLNHCFNEYTPIVQTNRLMSNKQVNCPQIYLQLFVMHTMWWTTKKGLHMRALLLFTKKLKL